MQRDRPITCRRCNSTVSVGSRFCGMCGARIPMDARQTISTHGTPVTLIIVLALPLVMIFAIVIVLASVTPPGISQTGGTAATQEPTQTSTGTPQKDSASGEGTSPTEPKGSQPEAPKVPQPEEDSGPKPGHNLIETPDGSLSVEVPQSWGVETGENSEKEGGAKTWSYYAGEYLTSSITTAPNLDDWYSTGTSGAYLVASKALAQQYTDYEITNSLFNAPKNENCAEVGPYDDYDRPPYSGKLQTWYGCGEDGATVYTLAASPEGRECVVALSARVSEEADHEPIQHLVDTLDVTCGRIAS